MKKLYTTVAAALFALTALNPVAAQTSKEAEAKTKLQSFDQQFGSVIIKGYSKIGSETGLYGGSLTVQSKEFVNAASGVKVYGLTFEVNSGSNKRESISFLDYDEIPSLLKGFEYISMVDKSATKLDGFEASYKTKDDLVFTVFSSDNGTMLAVESGRIASARAYFKSSDIGKINDLIVAAKKKLDTIK